MNQQQFEAAKKQFGSGGGFSIAGVNISGYANLNDAKEAGRREAREKRFNYDQRQSSYLLQNRVSSAGSEAYIKCLENENTGLRAWLQDKAGSIYKIAFKVKPGDPGDFTLKDPAMKNFKLASKIDNRRIDPNNRQTLTFERINDDKEGFIELKAGRLQDQVIFPPVLRQTSTEREVYTSSGSAKAKSCGHEGTRTGKLCEAAPKGWKFVPATGSGFPRPGHSEGACCKIVKVDVTPEQACLTITAYTGDADRCREFEAGFTVTQERPLETPETGARSPNRRR
jgi:hypothetical protein